MHFDIACAHVRFPTEGQCSYFSRRAAGISLLSVYFYIPSPQAFLNFSLFFISQYLCLLSSSYWCVLMGRPLLRCFSWDAFQMKQKKKKATDTVYTVGVQYRLRSIYIISPRVLPSSTSHLSPPIEQESVCLRMLVLHCDLCGSLMPYGTACPVL